MKMRHLMLIPSVLLFSQLSICSFRFNERQNNPYRQHKLTDEDWRNREKQPLYHVAVNHMVARTSTPVAPWTIVAANDKYFARVKVIETVIAAIETGLKQRG